MVVESDLCILPNFYAGMIYSYCQVNDLFYKNNKNLSLSHNIWATWKVPEVNKKWIAVGLYTLNKLLTQQGKLDLSGITELIGQMPDNYLIACRIKKNTRTISTCLEPGMAL